MMMTKAIFMIDFLGISSQLLLDTVRIEKLITQLISVARSY